MTVVLCLSNQGREVKCGCMKFLSVEEAKKERERGSRLL